MTTTSSDLTRTLPRPRLTDLAVPPARRAVAAPVPDAWVCWECGYESDRPRDRDRHRDDNGHTAIGALHFSQPTPPAW